MAFELSAVQTTGWQLRSVIRTVTLRCREVIQLCPVVSSPSPSVSPRTLEVRLRCSRHDHMIGSDFPFAPWSPALQELNWCSRVKWSNRRANKSSVVKNYRPKKNYIPTAVPRGTNCRPIGGWCPASEVRDTSRHLRTRTSEANGTRAANWKFLSVGGSLV